MPFVTEEIWQRLKDRDGSQREPSLMIQNLPHIQEQIIDKKIENQISIIFEIITSIRNMRKELEIPLEKHTNVIISTNDKERKELIRSLTAQIKHLAKIDNLKIEDKYVHIKSSITTLIKDIHITIPLEGVVDLEKEKSKIDERIQKIKFEIKVKKKNLSNKEFLKMAPVDVVEKEKIRQKELHDILKRLKAIRDEL